MGACIGARDLCNLLMDERRKKRIETVIAWVGYSIVLIGLIALLLGLVRLKN